MNGTRTNETQGKTNSRRSLGVHPHARELIDALAFGEDICWQTFGDGAKSEDLEARWFATLDEAWPRLMRLSEAGAGIFWTVSRSKGGRKKEHYTSARAAWIDVDRDELPEFHLEPSAVVKTGKGYHAYWILDGLCTGEALEAINRGIAKAHGGDRAACDRTRVMRLPGTYHRKAAPVLVRLIECDADIRYTPEELAAAYPAPVEVPPARVLPPAPRRTAEASTAYGLRGLEAECRELAAEPEGGRNARAFRAAAAVGQLIAGGQLDASAAREALLEACARCGLPPLEASEVVERGLIAGGEQPRRGTFEASPVRRHGSAPPAKVSEPPPPSDSDAPGDIETIGEPNPPPPISVPRKMGKNGPGAPIACAETAISLMLQDPVTRAGLRWDAFRAAVVAVADIAAPYGLPPVRAGQVVDAAAMHSITAGWIERYGVILSADHARDALGVVRHIPAMVVDSLADWIEGACAKWDGHPRLEDAARVYLGASSLASNIAFQLWMRQAAARAMARYAPVKGDCAMVLSGAQGAGKSRAVEALAPRPEWFLRGLPDLATRPDDVSRVTRGRSVIEIDELDAFRRADAERVKAWLSRPTDTYRQLYCETIHEYHRRFGVVVTINPAAEGWLRDTTGLRRWMVIDCEAPLNVAALEADRDQLWGQAAAEVRAGAKWWPTGVDVDVLAESSGGHAVEDGWGGVVCDWLDQPERRGGEVTVIEVARGALGIESGRVSPHDQTRIAAALRAAGYRRIRRRLEGGRHFVWIPDGPRSAAN